MAHCSQLIFSIYGSMTAEEGSSVRVCLLNFLLLIAAYVKHESVSLLTDQLTAILHNSFHPCIRCAPASYLK